MSNLRTGVRKGVYWGRGSRAVVAGVVGCGQSRGLTAAAWGIIASGRGPTHDHRPIPIPVQPLVRVASSCARPRCSPPVRADRARRRTPAHLPTSHSHWSPPTHVFHPPLPVTPFHAAVLPPLFCFSLLAIHSCPLGSRAVAARPRDALHFLPLRLIDNPAIHETSPGPSTSRPPPPPVKPLLSFTSRFPSLKTPRPLARLPPALPTNTTTTATTLSPAVSSTTSFHPSQSYI